MSGGSRNPGGRGRGDAGHDRAGQPVQDDGVAQGGAWWRRRSAGGSCSRQTTDLEERRLLNVVEEMAIASGMPVPPVYLLDDEPGINAFAAGYTPSDAVIGVNRGTLECLSRDELQGVMATSSATFSTATCG